MGDSIKISKELKTKHNIISADGTVKYDFMMSLQNIAIAKIISTVWMNEITLKGIANRWKYFTDQTVWKSIEEKIVANLSHLCLPSSVFQKMADIVKDLGKSILDWVHYHNDNICCHWNSKYSAINLMNNVTWTASGKIDYQRTAKNIFANKNILLDDKTKCRLACNYCLEDEIGLLAPKILEMFDGVDGDSEPMVYFWMKCIKGELNSSSSLHHNNMSDNEYIMKRLICDDRGFRNRRRYNDVPIRFMWNRLSDEEKERNVTLLVVSIENKDYLLSLLSNLRYDLQQKVFKEWYEHVLRCMLNDWLWGEYFLPTTFIVLQTLEFDNPLKYWRALIKIIFEMCINGKDVGKCMRDEYKSVFKRLWRETSIECKDYIIQFKECFLMKLFLTCWLSWERDKDIAEVILEDLTAVQKRNIALVNYGVDCCIKFIKNDHWDELEFFLKCTLSTQEDISFLKKELVKNTKGYFKYHCSKFESFDKVEHFLKWAFETEDEREKYKQTLRKKKKTLAYFF